MSTFGACGAARPAAPRFGESRMGCARLAFVPRDVASLAPASLAPTAKTRAAPVRGQRMAAAALFGGFSFGGGGSKKAASREALKEELLDLSRSLKRGVAASEDDKAEVEALAKKLEAMNPNKQPLATDLPTGKWLLEYTTSESILGLNKPAIFRPSGPIYQSLDVDSLRASNQETFPFFNEVYAELTPESKSKVKVQFKKFKILGLIPVTAPESAKGELDITYIDEDLRISRGNR